MLNASESIEDFTYIVYLQRVIMNSHNNPSPVGLVYLNWQIDHYIDCTGIAEVSGLNLVQTRTFPGLLLLLR